MILTTRTRKLLLLMMLVIALIIIGLDVGYSANDRSPKVTWYYDYDGDGYGDPNATTESDTDPGPEWVDNGDDCDDGDPFINPGATEVCNNMDDDCDDVTDEDLVFYYDGDGDGYGNVSEAAGCNEGMIPAGYVPDGGDCNDSNPNIHPGAEEISDDGIDNNCDGQTDEVVTKEFDDRLLFILLFVISLTLLLFSHVRAK